MKTAALLLYAAQREHKLPCIMAFDAVRIVTMSGNHRAYHPRETRSASGGLASYTDVIRCCHHHLYQVEI